MVAAIALLVGLAVLAVLAGDWFDRPAGWLYDQEASIKGGLGLGAAAVLLLGRGRGRHAGPLLSLLGAVGALAFFNLGVFHDRNYVHPAELFHYYLGAKYFPELGHDGLYVATLAVEPRLTDRKPPRVIRDLFTLTCYYLVFLVLLPIRSARVGPAALLVASALFFAIDANVASLPIRYGVASWVLAALLFAFGLANLLAWSRARKRPQPG